MGVKGGFRGKKYIKKEESRLKPSKNWNNKCVCVCGGGGGGGGGNKYLLL